VKRSHVVVLLAGLVSGCRLTVPLPHTAPPAIRWWTEKAVAVAASGPYASELVAGLRARLSGRVEVVSCVVGCPAVGVYTSVSLTPGPHEGATLRTCQAEVSAGKAWLSSPSSSRATLVRSVRDFDDCVAAVSALLVEPRQEVVQVPVDTRGPLQPIGGLLQSGRLAEARAQLLQVVHASPSSAGAWYDLAVTAELLEAADDAARWTEKAQSLAGEPWLLEALRGVRRRADDRAARSTGL